MSKLAWLDLIAMVALVALTPAQIYAYMRFLDGRTVLPWLMSYIVISLLGAGCILRIILRIILRRKNNHITARAQEVMLNDVKSETAVMVYGKLFDSTAITSDKQAANETRKRNITRRKETQDHEPWFTISRPITDLFDGREFHLDSYTIARLLRADGFIVQQVFLVEKKRQCVIVTNCEENAETMEGIRSRLEAQDYVLYVRPLVKEAESVELTADGIEQNQNGTSEFVLVIEEKRASGQERIKEHSWSSNTIFLREPSWDKKSPLNLRFYSLSTFHIFKEKKLWKLIIETKCSNFESCGCCGWYNRAEFLQYWYLLWEEKRCQSPQNMANFLDHLNRLIETKQIDLSLLRQNGQRIAVKYIVAADYQVVGSEHDAEKHLLDGMLLKLDDEHVTAFGAQNFSILRNVRTAYNETRLLKDVNEDPLMEPLMCCCQSMFLPEISEYLLAFDSKKGLDYRKAILTISHSRVLGQGQSGSPLVHLRENDAVAVGYLQRYQPILLPLENPDHFEAFYAFVPLSKQLEALLKFNKKFPLGQPVITELVLP